MCLGCVQCIYIECIIAKSECTLLLKIKIRQVSVVFWGLGHGRASMWLSVFYFAIPDLSEIHYNFVFDFFFLITKC